MSLRSEAKEAMAEVTAGVRAAVFGVPFCPNCHASMVKAEEQNKEGDWGVRWLCECKAKRKEKTDE